jgi:hypothetical protein
MEVLLRLTNSLCIHVNSMNFRMCVSLRYHQGNQATTNPYIKYTLNALNIHPRTKKDTIGTHLHGTSIVPHLKLLKTKTGS